VKLLVDENLPPALARALQAVFERDHYIEHVVTKFGRHGVTDQEWIEQLGAEGGWSVLSGDRNIAKKAPSRALLFRAKLVGFFPVRTVMQMPLHKKVARILLVWDSMVKQVSIAEQGAFEITERGEKFRQIAG
jgi:hypothetical protein